jgi:Protein of unknown function (DUF2489)
VNKLNENDVAALNGEIAHAASALLARQLPFLDGVRRLNALGHEVSRTGHDADFVIFVVVDSDTDHIPNVGARAMCAQTWLDQCDNEVKEVEEFYGKEVDAARKKLIERFSNGA